MSEGDSWPIRDVIQNSERCSTTGQRPRKHCERTQTALGISSFYFSRP